MLTVLVKFNNRDEYVPMCADTYTLYLLLTDKDVALIIHADYGYIMYDSADGFIDKDLQTALCMAI